MFSEITSYVLLVAVASIAVVLLSSRFLADRLVSAGLMPRAFLGALPMLHTAIRALGGVLVIAGLVVIGVEGGWLRRDLLDRYALPTAIIVLGLILLFLRPRKEAK